MQVRPDFLEYAIARVRQLGFDIVDMDEAARRTEADERGKPFAVISFDGAFRDNLKYALPILRRQQCPFTLYVPTALVDGVGEVWRQALEEIVATQNALAVSHGGETEYYATATLAEKRRAYASLLKRLRTMPEAERVILIRDLANQYGLDLERHCRELVLDWSELRHFAGERLCTIGAGGVHGYELAKLSPADARSEIEQSVRILKAQFGTAPVHFAYPVGDAAAAGPREFTLARELGLRTAVTTLRGGIYAGDRYRLHALPRVQLSGNLQSKRHVDVLATPALFSLGR
jgi:peptidoglycan/xylan/chitin deacetylase (PgdA/CDA1 family)